MYARTANKPRPRTSELKSFAAPTAGWIANRALADPRSIEGQGAAILDNYFPRAGSVKLRRGHEQYAVLEEDDLDVGALFSYRNGDNRKLFAANEEKIYDITTTPTEEVDSLTSADWSVVQFATTGNVFLVGVNGADDGLLYDGSSFTNPTITFAGSGLSTSDMSFVWVYKSRLWFVQKDSLTAWYMEDADAIGGNAVAFPLAGVFTKGGSLVFGQTWSNEAGMGGGLSEQCIFVSSEGEVAVYQGDDPSTAGIFLKVGVYRIGTPLGKHAFFRGGGDLAIATSVGLVPLSKAISLDVTSLAPATVSYRISDAWEKAVEQRGLEGWQCELWPELRMAVISPPEPIGYSFPVLFISNSETGAWCRFTGWVVKCMEVFEGQLYFGSTGGAVFKANSTGMDNGTAYSGTVLPLYEDVGAPGSSKVGKMARGVSRSTTPINCRLTFMADFDENIPTAPDATLVVGGDTWGPGGSPGEWGLSHWSDNLPSVVNQGWQSIGGVGCAISDAYQVTSGDEAPLDDDLIRIDMTYTTAAVVT